MRADISQTIPCQLLHCLNVRPCQFPALITSCLQTLGLTSDEALTKVDKGQGHIARMLSVCTLLSINQSRGLISEIAFRAQKCTGVPGISNLCGHIFIQSAKHCGRERGPNLEGQLGAVCYLESHEGRHGQRCWEKPCSRKGPIILCH